MRNKALLLLVLLFLVLATCGTVVAADNSTDRISISSDGNQSSGDSSNPSISADGRYIAFTSYASNLVPGDTNGVSDIFVRDTVLNTTERVSVSSTGDQSNGNSNKPSISADGRYIAFTSYASNLVPGDTNGVSDIFVRDRVLGITKLISVSSTGDQSNGDNNAPAISGNGCYIAFSSFATNLVPNDNNGKCDIFLYDNNTGQITRLSVSNLGTESNGDSRNPTINGDGSLISFISSANNLVENDANNYSGVFIYNRDSGTLEKVNTSNLIGNYYNFNYLTISSDGSYLAFTSPVSGSLFIYNTESKTIEQVEISWNGEPNSMTMQPSMSANGRYVAIASANHIVSDTTDRWMDIYIYDQISKSIRLITGSEEGDTSFYSSYEPSISADGHQVAFSSVSYELIPDDTNNCKDIYLYSEYTNLINATIQPHYVKTGDTVTIQVTPNPNITSVSANILNNIYSLIKGSNGVWTLNYLVPQIVDGYYPVKLTAIDRAGNQLDLTLGFTIDNTPPTLNATINPNYTKSGEFVNVLVSPDPDIVSVSANILNISYSLMKEANGFWTLDYVVPQIVNGFYPVKLTATDRAGNHQNVMLGFTVDNTALVVSGTLTPNTLKSYENFTINASSDHDTASIVASILNENYNLIQNDDGLWSFEYSIPYLSDGVYTVLLTATDYAGNQGNCLLNFTVCNPLDTIPPTVTASIIPNTYQLFMNAVKPENAPPRVNIEAFSDPDTISVIAFINGENISLSRQSDGSWLGYYFTWLDEGTYPVLITATDWSGNQGNSTIMFNVENRWPTTTVSINQSKLRSGDSFILTVIDPDAKGILAKTPSGYVDMVKSGDVWRLDYTVPPLPDGTQTIWMIIDYGYAYKIGYHECVSNLCGYTSVVFSVDNTPPNISGSTSPIPIKSGETLKILASCDSGHPNIPDDTANIIVSIFGRTFNMVQTGAWSDWRLMDSFTSWEFDYLVPSLSDGVYFIYFTATDTLGNTKNITATFTVDNTPPTITATITPNKFKYIDFSRPITSIMAQSSSDTKEIHVYLEDGSENILKYSNNQWILQLNFPYLIPLGNYVIKLKAFDYAGNEAESSLTYYVYQNLNVKNPLTKPSEPESSNNIPVDGSSSTESSSTGSASGSSSDAVAGSADESTDPNDGTPFLQIFLQFLLILGDICTILFVMGYAETLLWAIFTVWALIGFGVSLFLLFEIGVIVLGLILIIYCIYRIYTR